MAWYTASMSPEPDSLILQMLRDMRAEIGGVHAEVGNVQTKIASLREETATKSDLRSLRVDVASDLVVGRKETVEQIVGLRRAVIEYHSSVIGHGIIISELEARVRRVEEHLNLPTSDTH